MFLCHLLSSTLSSSEFQNLSFSSSSFTGDQTTFDLAFNTSSSSRTNSICLNQSVQEKSILNDISTSCNDSPIQPKVTIYLINHRKHSFEPNLYSDNMINPCKKNYYKIRLKYFIF
jgi:hypothetical protein